MTIAIEQSQAAKILISNAGQMYVKNFTEQQQLLVAGIPGIPGLSPQIPPGMMPGRRP